MTLSFGFFAGWVVLTVMDKVKQAKVFLLQYNLHLQYTHSAQKI